MNIYKYLYYRLYSWNLKTWGKQDVPQFNALLGVSFIMYLNLGIIIIFLDSYLFHNKLILNATKLAMIIFSVPLLTINYFWLVYNDKYKNITKIYEKESKHNRFRNTFLIWAYVILSIVIICCEAIIIGKFEGLQ